MTKKFAPNVPDIKWHRPLDSDYLRELLAAIGLSQRGAAVLLGINERTMRYKASGEQTLTYPEQYLLEAMADTGWQGKDYMTTHLNRVMPPKSPSQKMGTQWMHTGERDITREDIGKIVVGWDRFRAPVNGRVASDSFGLFINAADGIDVHRTPLENVTVYTLLDPPVE